MTEKLKFYTGRYNYAGSIAREAENSLLLLNYLKECSKHGGYTHVAKHANTMLTDHFVYIRGALGYMTAGTEFIHEEHETVPLTFRFKLETLMSDLKFISGAVQDQWLYGDDDNGYQQAAVLGLRKAVDIANNWFKKPE